MQEWVLLTKQSISCMIDRNMVWRSNCMLFFPTKADDLEGDTLTWPKFGGSRTGHPLHGNKTWIWKTNLNNPVRSYFFFIQIFEKYRLKNSLNLPNLFLLWSLWFKYFISNVITLVARITVWTRLFIKKFFSSQQGLIKDHT